MINEIFHVSQGQYQRQYKYLHDEKRNKLEKETDEYIFFSKY